MRYIVGFVLTLLFLVSCGSTQKIATLKPEPELVSETVLEKETSFISLPIRISLQEIESQLNKTLIGLLYQDDDLTADQIKINVWKDADIKISQENDQVKIVFPLRAEGTYAYNFDKFGLKLNGTKDFKLSGNFTFLSTVGLTNWQLKTRTTIQAVDWKEPPNIKVAGQNVSIEFLVNASLRLFKNDIENLIDASLAKNLNFKPQVSEALDLIAKPIQLNEELNTWFQLFPLEVYASEARIENNQINLQMGLKCTMETKVGGKNEAVFDKSKVVLKPVKTMPNKISANMVVFSEYEEASKIITQNFKGQKMGNGSKKVMVEDVKIWQKKGKLIVDLQVSGAITGHIYLSGYPMYNEQTKEIFFDQLNYILDTKNVLHRSANWLLKGSFLNTIRENCRYSIEKDLIKANDQLMVFLNNYQPRKGIVVNGTAENVMFKKIVLTQTGLAAFIGVEGKAEIEINGLE